MATSATSPGASTRPGEDRAVPVEDHTRTSAADALDELLRPPPVTSGGRALFERAHGLHRLVSWMALAAGVGIGFLAWSGGIGAGGDPAESIPRVSVSPTVPASSSPAEPASVVVHVVGAVSTPGLVELAEGARVADAIGAAGGALPEADVSRVNLAAPLVDGSQIWVPLAGEAEPPAPAAPSGGPVAGAGPVGGVAAGPVDINSADVAGLDELPGVGPATAAAIVDHRERNGPFATVDELLDVRGIGEAKLEQLRDLVRV